ncbi:MAG: asparagine synthase-related protein [Myxococcota bacterium]
MSFVGCHVPGGAVDPAVRARIAGHLGRDGVLWEERSLLFSAQATALGTDRQGQLQVVFEGRLSHAAALEAMLERRGAAPLLASPASMIAESWAHFGALTLDYLEGAYAFALWDSRTQSLLLVRDRWGHRPLYYSAIGDTISFGSALGSLALIRPLERDPARLPAYLLQGYPSPPDTMYRAVRALEPGCLVRWNRGAGGRRERYFAPAFRPHPAPPSLAEAEKELSLQLLHSLEEGLPNQGGTIASLGPSVESALLAVLAKSELDRPAEVLSLELDERERAAGEALEQKLGATRRWVSPPPLDRTTVEAAVRSLGRPFAAARPLWCELLAEATASGPVVLAEGADSVLGGRPHFVGGAIIEGVPEPLGRLGRAVAARVAELSLASVRANAEAIAGFFDAVEQPLERRVHRSQAVFQVPRLANLLRPELRRHAYDAASFGDRVLAETAGAPAMTRLFDHEVRTHLPEVILAGAEQIFGARGFSLLWPFLETPLVRWTGQLPAHYLVSGAKTKRLLRQTSEKWVGAALSQADVRDEDRWLAGQLDGPLDQVWRDAILPATARIYEYLQPIEVRSLIARDASWNPARWRQILSLLTLEIWLHQPDPNP